MPSKICRGTGFLCDNLWINKDSWRWQYPETSGCVCIFLHPFVYYIFLFFSLSTVIPDSCHVWSCGFLRLFCAPLFPPGGREIEGKRERESGSGAVGRRFSYCATWMADRSLSLSLMGERGEWEPQFHSIKALEEKATQQEWLNGFYQWSGGVGWGRKGGPFLALQLGCYFFRTISTITQLCFAMYI